MASHLRNDLDPPPISYSRLLRISFVAWTLVGLVEILPNYVYGFFATPEYGLGYLFVRILPRWYLWALLTPVVVWLGRRFPVVKGEGQWRSVLTVHFPASLGITFLHLDIWLLFRLTVYRAELEGMSVRRLAESFFLEWFPLDMVVYWAILGGYLAYSYGTRARARELEAANLELETLRLERWLTEARLAALTARLQPHFLFNTLNAIAELIHRDPDDAERMVVRLGDLLRLVLDRSERSWVTVAEELEVVEAYVAVERARYGSRLRSGVEVSREVEEATLPTLTLQPLVENAIRHGIARVDRPGRVDVVGERLGDRLRLEVRDDGAGLGDGGRSEGLGLGTTRRRLQEIYGDDFTLVLREREGGGAVTILELPFTEGEVVPGEGAEDRDAESLRGWVASGGEGGERRPAR